MTDHRLRVTVGADDDALDIIRMLDDASILIAIRPDAGWDEQLTAIALADLLGRLFPRIDFDVDQATPAHSDLPPGPALLADRLRDAHRRGGLQPQPLRPERLVVQVGPNGPAAALHVDGREWQSYLGPEPSELSSTSGARVAIGPLAAACRAAAAISQWALGGQLPTEPVYASALDYTTGPTPPDVDGPTSDHIDACLVGAGSVGGATIYTLAHTPGLSGSLVVVDPQQLEPHNVVRAILATAPAVAAAAGKAAVAEDALVHHASLSVTAVPSTVTAWHATLPRDATLPLTLVAVDSARARRAVQDCLPLDVLNAACHPEEITVSAHRTDDGPCVCCLHMGDVLDKTRVRTRLIAKATGIPEAQVNELVVRSVPLTPTHLRRIEQVRELPPGALARYERRTMLELWNAELLYGAVPVLTSRGGTVAVAAPYVTALAGVLLAGEALKASSGVEAAHRLGAHGVATKYEESIKHGPTTALLSHPRRWPTSECLCQSRRRLRLLHERYGQQAQPGAAF